MVPSGVTIRVHDAAAVRAREARSDVERATQGALAVQRPAVELLAEGEPLDELHDDEGDALVLLDVVDGRDAGMGERRRGPRLLEQAEAAARALGEHLERDRTFELGVAGAVDHPEAALAEPALDAEVPEPVARDELGRRVPRDGANRPIPRHGRREGVALSFGIVLRRHR